jgi:kynurenine formamidase
VPRARGEDFIDPSYLVRRDDLEAAELHSAVEVRTGDLLVISTGRHRRRSSLGGDPNPLVDGLAGLHPDCLPWLSEREVALLGSDGISDPMPPLTITDWPFPIHQIGIVGMGLFLIDNLDLGALSDACSERTRWEFLLVVAPLRLPGGTGSPLNPIAIF